MYPTASPTSKPHQEERNILWPFNGAATSSSLSNITCALNMRRTTIEEQGEGPFMAWDGLIEPILPASTDTPPTRQAPKSAYFTTTTPRIYISFYCCFFYFVFLSIPDNRGLFFAGPTGPPETPCTVNGDRLRCLDRRYGPRDDGVGHHVRFKWPK